MCVCVFSAQDLHELVEEASSQTDEPKNAELVRHDSKHNCCCHTPSCVSVKGLCSVRAG